MFFTFMIVSTLAVSTVSSQSSACSDQRSLLGSSASEWPKPIGDVSSYISSYSSAHNGVFSNCQQFTSGMPTSLSSPYQEWVTSANDWSSSFESTVLAAASTCVGLVAPVVIALPRCSGGSGSVSNNDASAAGSSSSASANGGSTASTSSSSATSTLKGVDRLFGALALCAGLFGGLAVML